MLYFQFTSTPRELTILLARASFDKMIRVSHLHKKKRLRFKKGFLESRIIGLSRRLHAQDFQITLIKRNCGELLTLSTENFKTFYMRKTSISPQTKVAFRLTRRMRSSNQITAIISHGNFRETLWFWELSVVGTEFSNKLGLEASVLTHCCLEVSEDVERWTGLYIIHSLYNVAFTVDQIHAVFRLWMRTAFINLDRSLKSSPEYIRAYHAWLDYACTTLARNR